MKKYLTAKDFIFYSLIALIFIYLIRHLYVSYSSRKKNRNSKQNSSGYRYLDDVLEELDTSAKELNENSPEYASDFAKKWNNSTISDGDLINDGYKEVAILKGLISYDGIDINVDMNKDKNLEDAFKEIGIEYINSKKDIDKMLESLYNDRKNDSYIEYFVINFFIKDEYKKNLIGEKKEEPSYTGGSFNFTEKNEGYLQQNSIPSNSVNTNINTNISSPSVGGSNINTNQSGQVNIGISGGGDNRQNNVSAMNTTVNQGISGNSTDNSIVNSTKNAPTTQNSSTFIQNDGKTNGNVVNKVYVSSK